MWLFTRLLTTGVSSKRPLLARASEEEGARKRTKLDSTIPICDSIFYSESAVKCGQKTSLTEGGGIGCAGHAVPAARIHVPRHGGGCGADAGEPQDTAGMRGKSRAHDGRTVGCNLVKFGQS